MILDRYSVCGLSKTLLTLFTIITDTYSVDVCGISEQPVPNGCGSAYSSFLCCYWRGMYDGWVKQPRGWHSNLALFVYRWGGSKNTCLLVKETDSVVLYQLDFLSDIILGPITHDSHMGVVLKLSNLFLSICCPLFSSINSNFVNICRIFLIVNYIRAYGISFEAGLGYVFT